MPVADTRNNGYGWWRSSDYIKTLQTRFPGVKVDQIIEAVRLAGPEESAIHNYILLHYLPGAADTATTDDPTPVNGFTKTPIY